MPNDIQRWNFAEKIASGLSNHPEYLFIFGIAVLCLAVGSSLTVAGVTLNSWSFLIPGCALVLASVGVCVYTVVVVNRRPTPRDDDEVHFSKRSIPAADFEEVVSAILANLETSAKITNQTFRKAVVSKLNDFLATSGQWARGEIRSEGSFNIPFDVYEHAEHEIFATSTAEFRATWLSPAGERLLRAHSLSRAEVVRVFVFNRRSEVTDDDLSIMKEHDDQQRIAVLVYFDEETPFTFPANLNRDFTIADGGASIGIASSFFGDKVDAQWFFGNQDLIPQLLGVKENLMRESIPLGDFLKQRA